MVTKNDVTGDKIKSKVSNDKFRDEYDRLFGKKKRKQVVLDLEDDEDSEIEDDG